MTYSQCLVTPFLKIVSFNWFQVDAVFFLTQAVGRKVSSKGKTKASYRDWRRCFGRRRKGRKIPKLGRKWVDSLPQFQCTFNFFCCCITIKLLFGVVMILCCGDSKNISVLLVINIVHRDTVLLFPTLSLGMILNSEPCFRNTVPAWRKNAVVSDYSMLEISGGIKSCLCGARIVCACCHVSSTST